MALQDGHEERRRRGAAGTPDRPVHLALSPFSICKAPQRCSSVCPPPITGVSFCVDDLRPSALRALKR